MKVKVLVLLLVIALCASLPTQITVANDVSEFDINGLEVIFKKTDGDVIAASLFLRGGVTNIDIENQGIERLLFEASLRGSEKYPKDLLNSELARMGAGIGVNCGNDYTVISLRCIDRYFPRSWDIFTDVLIQPTLDEKEVGLVRQQLITRAKQEKDRPDTYVWDIAETLFFEDHPYALKPGGTEASLANISLTDLRSYHMEHMVTSQLLLVIVGNVDPSDLMAKVTQSFGQLPKGHYRAKPLPPPRSSPGLDMVEQDIPTNYIFGLFSAPSPKSEEYPAMMIATNILSDRVFEEVRTKRNLAYAVGAGIASMDSSYGVLYLITAEPNPAMDIVFEEVTKLKQERIDDKTLQNTVKALITRDYMRNEAVSAQALMLGNWEIVGNGWENYLVFVERLQNVTPEDVMHVANKYLNNINFGILGDPSKIDIGIFTQISQEAQITGATS